MLRQVLAGTSQCNLTNWVILSTDSKLTLSRLVTGFKSSSFYVRITLYKKGGGR